MRISNATPQELPTNVIMFKLLPEYVARLTVPTTPMREGFGFPCLELSQDSAPRLVVPRSVPQ